MRSILSVLWCCVIGAAHAASEPFTPADDSVVLERQAAPKQTIAGLRALREQQRRLAQNPDDLEQAAAFARAAITLGRAEADPRYFGYAESALRPWIALAMPPPVARLLRATLRQQRHDFAGALGDLDALIAAGPSNAQARLTRATVLMVQGRPGEALRDCAALFGRASVLSAATCIAGARSLDGHAEAARATLDAALVNATDAGAEEKIWALTAAAEMAQRRGDAAPAEANFRAALATLERADARDPYLLTAWADFLLEHDRAAEVLPLLADFTRVDNALLRLTLAEDALANPAAAGHVRLLQARFDETRQRGDTVHLREETLFELRLRHDAARAVELGLQNWQSQREPADARLLLQAAVAAKKPDAAQPVLDWMTRTHIEDPALQALAAQLPTGAAR